MMEWEFGCEVGAVQGEDPIGHTDTILVSRLPCHPNVPPPPAASHLPLPRPAKLLCSKCILVFSGFQTRQWRTERKKRVRPLCSLREKVMNPASEVRNEPVHEHDPNSEGNGPIQLY